MAIDDHSRVGLSQMLADEKATSACAVLLAARRYYKGLHGQADETAKQQARLDLLDALACRTNAVKPLAAGGGCSGAMPSHPRLTSASCFPANNPSIEKKASRSHVHAANHGFNRDQRGSCNVSGCPGGAWTQPGLFGRTTGLNFRGRAREAR